MNGAKYIIKKELNRVFGDKKLIFSLFILPVALMVGMFFLMGNLMDNMSNDVADPVATVYIQDAPECLQTVVDTAGFKSQITYVTESDDLEAIKQQIINGDKDLLVVFDKDFMDAIQNYKEGNTIPEVRTFYNPSEEYSSTARTNFVAMVLEPMKQSLLKIGRAHV